MTNEQEIIVLLLIVTAFIAGWRANDTVATWNLHRWLRAKQKQGYEIGGTIEITEDSENNIVVDKDWNK